MNVLEVKKENKVEKDTGIRNALLFALGFMLFVGIFALLAIIG